MFSFYTAVSPPPQPLGSFLRVTRSDFFSSTSADATAAACRCCEGGLHALDARKSTLVLSQILAQSIGSVCALLHRRLQRAGVRPGRELGLENSSVLVGDAGVELARARYRHLQRVRKRVRAVEELAVFVVHFADARLGLGLEQGNLSKRGATLVENSVTDSCSRSAATLPSSTPSSSACASRAGNASSRTFTAARSASPHFVCISSGAAPAQRAFALEPTRSLRRTSPPATSARSLSTSAAATAAIAPPLARGVSRSALSSATAAASL